MQNEQNVTEKSNAVEHMPAFDKIKPCEFTHGSCSKLHTPLRGEQQATQQGLWLRGNYLTVGFG